MLVKKRHALLAAAAVARCSPGFAQTIGESMRTVSWFRIPRPALIKPRGIKAEE